YKKDLWSFDPVANAWTQLADMPGPRARAAAFSVGGKGYVAGGITSVGSGDNTYTNTTYGYDPSTNTWAACANFPGARMRMVSFAIGSKGYAGCGAEGFNISRNIHAYDPVANTWTNMGGFGDTSGRDWGFALAIGNKGYIGGGHLYSDWSKTYYDFWCFDPATTSFTPRQYLGGMDLRDCGAFSMGGKGFFVAGSQSINRPTQEAWQYDPATGQWTKRTGTEYNFDASATFTIGTQAYKVGGVYRDVLSYFNYNMRYNPGTDLWSFAAAMPTSAGGRAWGVGFSANGKGYVGLGLAYANTLKNDLWQYDPANNAWTQKATFPGGARQKSVAFRIGGKVYVGTGVGAGVVYRDMWAYDPMADTWTQKADFGGTARYGAVAFTIGGKGYIATGYDGAYRKDLWEYDPATDTWTQKADFGGVPRDQAFAFVAGNKAYVGAGEIGTTSCTHDMWEYTPVASADQVQLRPKVLLDGPYDSASGLMSDALRTAGLVPLTEPYTALGYDHASSGGEATTSAVLAATGPNAIVDWVVVELHHPSQPGLVVASTCALLQRDGDVVGTDGVSPVRLPASAGSYYIAIQHRNHLGAMTASAVAVGTASTMIDLSLTTTMAYGVDARKVVGGRALLWTGDVHRDARIAYTGAGNDRDPILVAIGGSVPTQVVNGVYSSADVNMDAMIKYTGAGNDRDPILQSIGGGLPTQVRNGQVP
ncbi:MAG: hypothetical protein JST66_10280, partial [Bacteroidetes bacterium]|nr:hypothetical protein [Bacteroidota bacterium]